MKKISVDASLMGDVVEYIKCAQAVVGYYERVNVSNNRKLQEKVAHAVGCMVDKGLVDPSDSSNLISELSRCPEKIAEALITISQKADLPVLGEPSGSPDTMQMDELTKLAYLGH